MVDWRQSSPGAPWVTGVAISSDPGDDDTYALGDVIQVRLTFSNAVNATGTPRVKIDFSQADGDEQWADYTGGSGTASLTFAHTVAESNGSSPGVAVLRNTLELNGGAIQSTTTTPVDADLAHPGLEPDPAHQVDDTTPSLRSVTAGLDGTRLVLTFDEALDEDSVPASSAFTVKVNGSAVSLANANPVAIAEKAVILTLAAAVAESDTTTVSYDRPASDTENKLRDLAGNRAASFTDQATSADTTPPTLVRGEVDGSTLTLYFSEPLDEDSGGAGDYFFRLSMLIHPERVNHTFIARGEVEISGNKVDVHMQYEAAPGPVRPQEGSNVAYYAQPTDPTADRLQDLAGNVVWAPHEMSKGRFQRTEYIFLDNLTGLPSLEHATVNGDRLTLTFDETLDEDSVPAANAFTVKVNGSAVSLDSDDPVAIAGNTVTLTLAAAVSASDTLTVRYAKPSANPLRNAFGAVRNFADVPAGTVPKATTPVISSTPPRPATPTGMAIPSG